MNVIAADMCTNARRVRKRWLPKIKSMLPEGMEVYRSVMGSTASSAALEPEFQPSAAQMFEQRIYAERRGEVGTLAALRTNPATGDQSGGSGPLFEPGDEADGPGSVTQESASAEAAAAPESQNSTQQPFEPGPGASSRPETPARRPEGTYAGTL